MREVQGGHLSFVMGIFRPVIYLTAGLEENSRRVVLCHERVHLKRRDYLFKPAALGVCCLHWFNPLVWVAFYLMNKDCEMSCDEKVMSLLGEESKKIYSYALLDEATKGESFFIRRKGTVCALLSFGEDNVKRRIRHVLKYKRASVWTIVCAVLILAILTIGICSNPDNPDKESMSSAQEQKTVPEEDTSSSEADSEVVAETTVQENSGQREDIAILLSHQQTPDGALHAFAEAFYEKSGDKLYMLSADKEKFAKWDIITTQADGSYTVGDASLWVESYELDYEEGNEEAVIRFFMECATQEITIADERVTLVKKDDLYYVEHEEFTLYDNIETREELAQVFELTEATPYDVGSTSYAGAYPRTVLKHIVYGTNPEHYKAYKDPVTAAQTMLHLGKGTGKVTEVLHLVTADEVPDSMSMPESVGSSMLEQWRDYAAEGTVVNVQYTFAKDNSKVDIPMVLAEESEGIWVLSCGNLTEAGQQVGEPLANDRVRKVYAEYTADGRRIETADDQESQAGNGNTGSTTSGNGKGTAASGSPVGYQVSSFGIYRVDETGMTCIYPTLMPEDTILDVYEGKLYFPADSEFFASELIHSQRGLGEGALDWWYDSICVLDSETGEYYYLTLLKEEQKLFPLTALWVEDGVVHMEGGTGIRRHAEISLADRGLVWNGKYE